jgi:hypothetical protein
MDFLEDGWGSWAAWLELFLRQSSQVVGLELSSPHSCRGSKSTLKYLKAGDTNKLKATHTLTLPGTLGSRV